MILYYVDSFPSINYTTCLVSNLILVSGDALFTPYYLYASLLNILSQYICIMSYNTYNNARDKTPATDPARA